MVQDNVTDASLFRLSVQANGADGFKLALCLISSGLEGMDPRVVHTLHDEIIVEARDGIAGRTSAGTMLTLCQGGKARLPFSLTRGL